MNAMKKNVLERKVVLGSKKFVGISERFMAGAKTVLVFESEEYPLGEIHATVTDGTIAKRHVIRSAKLDITEYCKGAGIIEIRLDLVDKGAVVKTWLLEPFVVHQNGGGYELIPEIALLRREIRMMKKALKELNSKIDETM